MAIDFGRKITNVIKSIVYLAVCLPKEEMFQTRKKVFYRSLYPLHPTAQRSTVA